VLRPPVAVALLCALVVLAVITLARLGRMAGERDASSREAADLRARLETFAQASAQHERYLREELARARH